MPQKRTGGGRKKKATGGKRRTGGGGKGGGKKASRSKKKTTPKQSKQQKQSTTKKERRQKRDEKVSKESGENGGIEKREIAGNVANEFQENPGEILKDNIPPLNPVQPAINTVSKETNTQSQENAPPTAPGVNPLPKPKRIKDPTEIASKLQIQGIAASRSVQLSALILPESFLMNRFGATFIPPQNLQSISAETGKASTDDSDTASTSGDDEN